MEYRNANRFDAAVFAAVALVIGGTILGNESLFVAAAVPVTYLAVGTLTGAPPVSSLSIERTFDPELPAPGERTTVTLTVTNEGGRTIPDVRIVDRLPDPIPVSEGSPRGCLSLRPGETGTITYEVVPSQGEYEFEAPLTRLRPLPAVGTVTGEPTVSGTETLRCRRGVSDVPQTQGSLRRVGTQPTDTPGQGLEFHSVREYRSGDDINRIDWRTLAKSGELSTVNFDETRATKTVLLVDGRPPARRSRSAGYPTGAELSAYAADRAFERLLAAGNQVGLTAFGIEATAIETTLPSDRSGRPWVPPGNDPATRTRVGAVLDAVVEAGQSAQTGSDSPTAASAAGATQRSTSVPDGGVRPLKTGTADLRARLPSAADIVVTTPLLDDDPIAVVETLAANHSVVVVSPDVTGTETPGGRLASIERRHRIGTLRTAGATVIDWNTAEPLSAALEVMR
jgi:uncharacterized repeat protein (TIGR01451 family)